MSALSSHITLRPEQGGSGLLLSQAQPVQPLTQHGDLPDVSLLIIPDGPWRKQHLRLSWLRWRLFYEQFRLGSDAESPTMRRLLYKARFTPCLPARTIGAWRQAIRHFSR